MKELATAEMASPSEKTAHISWRLHLFFYAAACLVLAMMSYGFYSGQRMTTEYTPLIDAAMEIKLEATTAHLWFEEIMSDDRQEGMINDVFAHLDNAEWYAGAMLEGGKNPEGKFVPLADPVMRRDISSVREKLAQFRQITIQRLESKHESGVGSEIDQYYDAVFHSFLEQADKVETQLQQRVARDLSTYRRVNLFLLFGCFLLFAFLGFTLYRFDRHRVADMAAIHQAREKLSESEQWYSTTMSCMGDAVITTDTDGRVTYLNDMAVKLTGWPLAEARGKELTEVFHIINEDTRQRAVNPVDKVIREKIVVGLANHTALISRNGEEYSIADSGAPIIDDSGNLFGVVLIFHDTSEKRRAREALQRSEQEWANAMNFFGDAIFIVGLDDRVLRANKICSNLTGRSEESIVGSDITSILHPRGETTPCPICMARREKRDADFTMEPDDHGNPAERPMHVMVRVIRNQSKEPVSLVVSLRDLSDQRRIEEELKRHRDELEALVDERTESLEQKTEELEEAQVSLQYLLEDVNESNKKLERANEKLLELDRLKSMFIASMSHELRTPLNSIIGFTGMVVNDMTGPINDKQRDYLQRANRAGNHLLALITDVIDISKIEAGMLAVYYEDFELDEVVQEAVASVEAEAQSKNLTLSSEVDKGVTMHSDRKRLLQCLLNLLSNAVKYSERGSVTVTAKSDGNEVEISVTDQGIGIPEKQRALLFQPFVRLDSPLKMYTAGTGLGLYLTRKLARDILAGDVRCTGQADEGSVFIMRLAQKVSERDTSKFEEGNNGA